MSLNIAAQRNWGFEMLRGLASMLVVLHHYVLGFAPGLWGMIDTGFTLVGTPFYWLVNGAGAVSVFFVLSGYVLAYQISRLSAAQIGFGFVPNRIVRLGIPIFASLLLSIGLFTVGWMWFQDAAVISASPWLNQGAYGGLVQDLKPKLVEALTGTWRALVVNTAVLNTNLWTMPFEFYGGVMAAIMIVGCGLGRRVSVGKGLAFIALCAVVVMGALWPGTVVNWSAAHMLLPFAVGAVLFLLLHGWRLTLLWVRLALISASLGMFCIKHYPPVGGLLDQGQATWVGYSLASSMMLVAFKDMWMGPRTIWFAHFIGRRSFALYLVHTLVILSFGSFLFVSVTPQSIGEWVIHAVLTVVVIMLVAEIFLHIDRVAIGFGRGVLRLSALITTR